MKNARYTVENQTVFLEFTSSIGTEVQSIVCIATDMATANLIAESLNFFNPKNGK